MFWVIENISVLFFILKYLLQKIFLDVYSIDDPNDLIHTLREIIAIIKKTNAITFVVIRTI